MTHSRLVNRLLDFQRLGLEDKIGIDAEEQNNKIQQKTWVCLKQRRTTRGKSVTAVHQAHSVTCGVPIS
eukprot:1613405-Amphidinium_carterae.3